MSVNPPAAPVDKKTELQPHYNITMRDLTKGPLQSSSYKMSSESSKKEPRRMSSLPSTNDLVPKLKKFMTIAKKSSVELGEKSNKLFKTADI